MENFKKIFFYLIFLIVGIYLLLINNIELNTISKSYLISMLSFSSFFAYRYCFLTKNFNSIPIFEFINVYFIFCYINFFFFEKNLIFDNFSVQEYEYAIKILFYGYFSFILGYLIIFRISKSLKKKEINYLNCSNQELFSIGITILVGIIIFFVVFDFRTFIPGLDQIRFPLQIFGTGLLLKYIFFTNPKTNFFNIKNSLSIFLILIMIMLEFTTGSYTLPFVNIFLLTIFYYYLKNKVYILPLIILILLFSFAHIGKYDFRDKIWSNNLNLSKYEKIKIFFSTYKTIIIEEKSFSGLIKKDDNKLNKRIFHSIESLIIVTSLTPEKIPHWNGYSYKILQSKLIPRFLWKDKPSEQLGNEFGHRYNILNKFENNFDKQTSWNMPVLNEFYVNFGEKGVLIGMCLFGVIVSLISNILRYKNKYNIESTISFFVLMPLFFLESHLSLLIGNIIQIYLFIFLSTFSLLFIIRKLNFNGVRF